MGHTLGHRISHCGALGLVLLANSACRGESAPQGDAPPALTSVSAGTDICLGARPASLPEVNETFAAELEGLCIDPNGEARVYGDGQGEPLDGVCSQLFNGECEVYKAFGLRRVVTVRYVDRKGSAAAVTANLSRFSGSEGAYAFFTHRVLAGSDPKRIGLRPLAAGGGAALGAGVAYVWKANQVLELAYTNEAEAPQQVRESSNRLLPTLATLLGERLRGDLELPESVRRLPEDQRLPLGVLYDTRDAFQISGLGAGATGFYEHAGKRYRVFLSVNPDPSLAKDMVRSMRRMPGLRTLKDVPYDAFELHGEMVSGSAVTHWLVGRNEQSVAAIGDESLALDAELNTEQRRALSLDKDQKMALLRKVLR